MQDCPTEKMHFVGHYAMKCVSKLSPACMCCMELICHQSGARILPWLDYD